MLKNATKVSLAMLSLGVALNAQAQDKKGDTKAPAATPAAAAAPKADSPKPGPKPYKEVITDKAKTSKGLFTVHKIEDKYFFEIPDSLMGREIMTVTRVSKSATVPGSVGLPAYGGELLNRQVIRFEKGPENKVFLRGVQYINVSADSTQPIYKAVRNSNVDPIAQAFEVKAYKKDSVLKSTNTVIDVSDFFKSENQIISLPPIIKTSYKLTTLAPDRTYLTSIKTYPLNTEIRAVRTYNGAPSMPGAPSAMPSVSLPSVASTGVMTMEVNTSMILLP